MVQCSRTTFKKSRVSTQSITNYIFKKNLTEEACQEIGSFFLQCHAIPFNVTRRDEFYDILELVARHGSDGTGFKPPSYPEIRVKY